MKILLKILGHFFNSKVQRCFGNFDHQRTFCNFNIQNLALMIIYFPKFKKGLNCHNLLEISSKILMPSMFILRTLRIILKVFPCFPIFFIKPKTKKEGKCIRFFSLNQKNEKDFISSVYYLSFKY